MAFRALRWWFWILLFDRAYAQVHFTLSGSTMSSHLGLNRQIMQSASAAVAFDVGTSLRLGVTHRQSVTKDEGLTSWESSANTANSVDLTVILYQGNLWMPYGQAGFLKKDYKISTENKILRYSLAPVPYAGVGVGLKVSQNFSLKLSSTISPGIHQKDLDSPLELAMDVQNGVGISYDM